MKNWLYNIFAIDKHSVIQAATFNHCSTLCPSKTGVILAWYAGSGECRDDQSVYITYLSHGKSLPPLRIGDKTGNPIVWRENNQLWLLWSKFEDDGPMLHPAHRWRHCSLWIQQIKHTRNMELLGKPIQLSKSSHHLLARTNPLIMPQLVLLPLYDEVAQQCVIYKGSNGSFDEVARYGNTTIQPAIWWENNKLHSLARNFKNDVRRSIYYYSNDLGHSWQYGGPSQLWNINNSLAVTKWDNQHIVLWNNIDDIRRKNMSIGTLKLNWSDNARVVPHAHVIKNLNQDHGSYPSLCVDDTGLLHFAYTGPHKQIEYHVWNRKTFRTLCERS